jgi:hypothetical protein
MSFLFAKEKCHVLLVAFTFVCSIGLLAMLTDGEGNAAPIDFMMDLT